MESRAPDRIGIGAGPANLFMFIQAKLHNPQLDIRIFEKRLVYPRSHLLEINPKSLKGAHPDPAFQELLCSFGTKVRTNALEAQLKAFAESIGIRIEYREIIDCAALSAEFPSVTRIVSACGARGVTREQIFGNALRDQASLQHIAEIKYDVKGSAKPLNTFKHLIPIECHISHFAIEHVGHESDGTTPVTVRFFISAEEYEAMSDARGKNYFTLNGNHPTPRLLQATIENWLHARQELGHESRVEESERITVTELGIYCSQKFATIVNKTEWVLLGDEAFGVPFFRSLNNALLCGTQLARAVAFDQPLDDYLAFAESLATQQINYARQKSGSLAMLQVGRNLAAGKLPIIGTNKLSLLSVSIFTPTISANLKRDMQARNRAARIEALPLEEDEMVEVPRLDNKKGSGGCVMF